MSEPGAPRNNPTGLEEAIAIFVAFSTIGTIVLLSLMRGQGDLNVFQNLSKSPFQNPNNTANPLLNPAPSANLTDSGVPQPPVSGNFFSAPGEGQAPVGKVASPNAEPSPGLTNKGAVGLSLFSLPLLFSEPATESTPTTLPSLSPTVTPNAPEFPKTGTGTDAPPAAVPSVPLGTSTTPSPSPTAPAAPATTQPTMAPSPAEAPKNSAPASPSPSPSPSAPAKTQPTTAPSPAEAPKNSAPASPSPSPTESAKPKKTSSAPAAPKTTKIVASVSATAGASKPRVELPLKPAQPKLLGKEPAFRDIPQNFWARGKVLAIAERGIVSGFPDGTFRPNQPVTRAQLASVLGKTFESEKVSPDIKFKDVRIDYWAVNDVDESTRSALSIDNSQKLLEAEQNIPRVQVLVSLASGLGLQPKSDPEKILQNYKDAAEIPQWARTQVAAATEIGLVFTEREPKVLNPNAVATRADIADLIYQALKIGGEVEKTAAQ